MASRRSRREQKDTASPLYKESFADVQIKDEPEDADYDQKSAALNDYNSSTDSLDSSPLPPICFENPSPQDISSPVSTSTSQIPLNDLFAGSSIRSKLRGAINSKKMDSIQNIIEGLLKKNETLLAMSDAGLHKPRAHKKTAQSLSTSSPVTAKSCVFPVSSSLQAHVVSGKQKIPENSKARMKRPKSPTLRHASVLKDKTNFTYALMESSVSDEEIEKIFKVQKHELVCGMGSKSYIEDKSHKLVALLDVSNYWCNFCPYTTTSKSLLVHHTLEHRFSCKFCVYESFCRSDVVRHMHKLHPEFKETADRFYYCTFLSDYLRVKSCLVEKENTNSGGDRDDDVEDSDVLPLQGRKKRKLHSKKSPLKKSAKLDSEEALSFEKNDSDHNSLSPDQLEEIKTTSKDSDYDMFEMEVEEIGEPSQDTVCEETVNERPVYIVNHESPYSNSRNKDLSPFPTSLVQVIPPGQQSNSNLSPVIQPEKLHETHQSRSNTRCNEHSRSSSNLFWSCGHCTFQSSSQLDIKAHSNREHIGKPYRYVALIRNLIGESNIPTVKTVGSKSACKSTANISSATNETSASPPCKSSIVEEDVVSLKDSSKTLKVKLVPMRMVNRVYTCYHCSYTAKRQSSMKNHIYYQHRGKCLVAVDAESMPKQNVFFCARDDCTFKSEKPDAFLQHVDQCTPWNKPELADVEVEPHIRQCLDQTIGFAKMSADKVIENEMERPLCSQISEESEAVFLRTCLGEQTDVESVHEDCPELVNWAPVLDNDMSEGESDCESIRSVSSIAVDDSLARDNCSQSIRSVSSIAVDDSLAGDNCFEVETNLLNLSASSTDSFIPVAFIDVKCHLPSDYQCSASVQEIAEENVTQIEGEEDKTQSIVRENETQNIVVADKTQTIVAGNITQKIAGEDETQKIAGEDETQKIAGEDEAQKMIRENETQEIGENETLKIGENETLQMIGENETYTTEGENETYTTAGENETYTTAGENETYTTAGENETQTVLGGKITSTLAIDQLDNLSEDSKIVQQSEWSQTRLCSTPIDDKSGADNSAGDFQMSSQSKESLGISIKELDEVTQHTESSTLDKLKCDSLVSAGNEDMASNTFRADHVEVGEPKSNILKDDDHTEREINKKRSNSVKNICEDINRLTKKESLQSPAITKPLKLTFKLIGDKTICSISGETDKDSKEIETVKIPSPAKSDHEEISEAKEGQVPKWINELIDSSSDSESDSIVLTPAIKEEIKESKPAIGLETGATSKFVLTCLPARSAAVKALSKMKPALDELEESTPDEDYDWHYRNTKPMKKSKSSHSQSNVNQDTGNISSVRENNYQKNSAKNKVTYACKYCSRVDEGPLKKIKSHVLLKHSSQTPLVINCLKRNMQKPCTSFVCSHPACYKLSNTKKGYFKHKASHQNIASIKDSGKSTVRKVHSSHHVTIPKKVSSRSETLQSCSVELDVLDLGKTRRPSADASKLEKKYQCLYCTHYFYDSSLSGMKSHYMSEHEGQLMVMRDTEARRAQLPSRIYVCEMPNCECCYINRPDLYHHSKSHKSNSTYIYECVSCGWYSSSQDVATQHLKTAHSDEKNVSLIHMQVSIDENGQTSKKVL